MRQWRYQVQTSFEEFCCKGDRNGQELEEESRFKGGFLLLFFMGDRTSASTIKQIIFKGEMK